MPPLRAPLPRPGATTVTGPDERLVIHGEVMGDSCCDSCWFMVLKGYLMMVLLVDNGG